MKDNDQTQEPRSSTAIVTVRPFDPADKEFILNLASRLTIGIPPWRDPERMLATARAWLTDSMDKHGEDGFVFVAQDADDPQGQRLGVATVARSKHFTGTPEAYLGELVVSEEGADRAGERVTGNESSTPATKDCESASKRMPSIQNGRAHGRAGLRTSCLPHGTAHCWT